MRINLLLRFSNAVVFVTLTELVIERLRLPDSWYLLVARLALILVFCLFLTVVLADPP